MATSEEEEPLQNAVSQHEPSNIIASLQMLSSRLIGAMPDNKKFEPAQQKEKPKSRRGRKKRIPQKPCQHPILPKGFAIQITQRSNVIGE